MNSSYSPNAYKVKIVKIKQSLDKEKVISQLRRQVFDLEQNELNYNTLNQKFKTLSYE